MTSLSASELRASTELVFHHFRLIKLGFILSSHRSPCPTSSDLGNIYVARIIVFMRVKARVKGHLMHEYGRARMGSFLPPIAAEAGSTETARCVVAICGVLRGGWQNIHKKTRENIQKTRDCPRGFWIFSRVFE